MALPKIMSNCKLYRIPLQMQAGVESICRVRWVKFKACGKDPCMKFQYLKKRMSELELGLKTNTSWGMWLSFLMENTEIENSTDAQVMD